jgi:hypothetical protein
MKGVFKFGLVSILVALLALTVAACGGDDSDTTPAEAQRQAQAEAKAEAEARNAEVLEEFEQRKQAEAPSEEEQEAGQSATRFYEVLGADKGGKNRTTIDSASFCDLMSAEAREQTVKYAEVSSGIDQEWDCESAVELLVLRSKRTGGFKGARNAEVIGVNVQGDRATATVRFGKGPATSISLVREDGEWKLGSTPGVGR